HHHPPPDFGYYSGYSIGLWEYPGLIGLTRRERPNTMTGIQPELWVDNPREAVDFYAAAFGARPVHIAGAGDDIVAQLAVGDSAFWVASTSVAMKRLSPRSIDGATSRTLLVVDDPETFVRQAVAAGASETSPVAQEHGWRVGRIVDPFGHEWEIGAPLGPWPPRDAGYPRPASRFTR